MKIIVYLILAVTVCTIAGVQTHAQSVDLMFDTARIRPVAAEPTKVEQKQVPAPKQKAEKQVRSEAGFGIHLNTDGYSLFTEFGKSKFIDSKHGDRFYNVHLCQIEISEKKSPRELKSSSGTTNSTGGANTYIYGKINNFYVLKMGFANRKMIAGKTDNPGSVSIHWVNALGFAAGFVKPYYLNVAGAPGPIKFSDNESSFLNPTQIIGSAGFSTGIGEMVFNPGGYFKTAFHFDFSGNLRTVWAVEAGADLEMFEQNVQLMANTPGTTFFADVFLAFQFGRRW